MHFLTKENTKWQKTELRCPRDGKHIYREVYKDGRATNHFCCERSGCTWADYGSNILSIKRKLGEVN